MHLPFHFPLKPKAVFKKQRASKFPLPLQDKVNKLADVLEQNKIISTVNKEQQPKENAIIKLVTVLASERRTSQTKLQARFINSQTNKSKAIGPSNRHR